MKKYKVNVDGEVYEVSIEEIESDSGSSEVKTEVQKKVEEPKPEVDTTSSAQKQAPKDIEGDEVKAALPGTITSIEVSEGDSVSKGQVLFVHEAMKMENEIKAPVAGSVKAIMVKKGEEVDTGKVLAVIG